jgi:hypothetical protein
MTSSSGITRKLENQATHLDCYPDFCDPAAVQGVELWEQIWEQNSAKRLGRLTLVELRIWDQASGVKPAVPSSKPRGRRFESCPRYYRNGPRTFPGAVFMPVGN